MSSREMTKEESDKFWEAVRDAIEKTNLWPKWKRAAYDLDSERLSGTGRDGDGNQD